MSDFMDQISSELSRYGLRIEKVDVPLGELEHDLSRLASAVQVIVDIEFGVSVVPREAADVTVIVGAQSGHIFYDHSGPEEILERLQEEGEVLLHDNGFAGAISKSVEPTGNPSYTIIYLDCVGKTHVLSTPVRGIPAIMLSATPAIQTTFSATHGNIVGYRDGEQVAVIVRMNILSNGSLGSMDVMPPIHTADAAEAASEFIDSEEMESDIVEMSSNSGPYVGIIVLHDERLRRVLVTTLGFSIQRFDDGSVIFEPKSGESRIREYREAEGN